MGSFWPVSGLSKGSGRPPSRREREKRAYTLVLVGGGAAAVAVVGFVLALVGVLGLGVPLIAALVAIVCGLVFRSTVGRS